MANWRWRGVIRLTFKSFEAFPANSRTYKRIINNNFIMYRNGQKEVNISKNLIFANKWGSDLCQKHCGCKINQLKSQ
jgi:hypothetical protein